MKKLLLVFAAAFCLAAGADSAPQTMSPDVISDVVVRQQWPWSPEVFVTFKIGELPSSQLADVMLRGKIGTVSVDIPVDAVKGPKKGLSSGIYTQSFDPTHIESLARLEGAPNFRIEVVPVVSSIDPDEPFYMIVDLTKNASDPGVVTYLSRNDILSGAYGAYECAPSWIRGTPALEDACLIWTGVTGDDVYKTTKLVLRRVKAGTFTMGLRSTDAPGASNSGLHEVMLTSDFWVGVFEVTQKQWELVMGENPAQLKADARPVEMVSFEMIRGSVSGANWPNSTETVNRSDVDAESFMGRLRAKVPSEKFDLPTEAQWEYACRAGTETALNSGENLNGRSWDENLSKLGRYSANQADNDGGFSSGHTTVGSYLPNAWGLYDMHGNVWEWCLDWNANLGSSAVTDPIGPASGTERVSHGSGWFFGAGGCKSGFRGSSVPSFCNNDFGFRVFVSK